MASSDAAIIGAMPYSSAEGCQVMPVTNFHADLLKGRYALDQQEDHDHGKRQHGGGCAEEETASRPVPSLFSFFHPIPSPFLC